MTADLNFSFFVADMLQLLVQRMYRSHAERQNDFTQNDLKIADEEWLNSAELSHKDKTEDWWLS